MQPMTSQPLRDVVARASPAAVHVSAEEEAVDVRRLDHSLSVCPLFPPVHHHRRRRVTAVIHPCLSANHAAAARQRRQRSSSSSSIATAA